MLDADFALFNVDQLVTVAPDVHPDAVGPLGVLEGAALAAKDNKIVWIGRMDDLRSEVRLGPEATILNAHGRVVLPGFVDAHTHPIFAGDRIADFYARSSGQPYEKQLESGIMHTVRETRKASEAQLLNLAYQRAETFLQYGTTTIQGKTGYGLTAEDECKSLRVLNRLQHIHPLKVVPAFLGAHLMPEDYAGSADQYIREVTDQWLPMAQDAARLVDVWSDEGVFTESQCRSLLTRARELGFELTAHANELGPGPGIRLACELGCLSVDHAVYADDDDIAALASGSTVAVLLPGTTLFLGSDQYAPARRMLEAGVCVAIGTDFNPGTSYTQNMQFILTLAVLKLHMSAEEAIQAATLHGARALGMEDMVGSLRPGKYCDFTVFCVGDYRAIPYFYAMNLVESVVAGGRVVVQEGNVVSSPPLSRPA